MAYVGGVGKEYGSALRKRRKEFSRYLK